MSDGSAVTADVVLAVGDAGWHNRRHITRFRFTLSASAWRPGATNARDPEVKKDIHPEYVVTEVTCSCGNSFTTRSTSKSGSLHADVCS